MKGVLVTLPKIYSGNKKERNNQAVKKYQQTEKGKTTTHRHQRSEKTMEHRERLKTDEKRIKYNRMAHLRHCFGLTLEDYDKMSEEQNGVCAICDGINLDGRRLYVDHDHETGKVRGLLCLKCNNRLGVLENKDWRLLAEKYLQY